MKVLMFLIRFFETFLKVTGAGVFGTYIVGWKNPFPISWIWAILSIIGGFVASSFGVRTFKIVIVSFAWPIVPWLMLGIFLGICIASYEFTSKSDRV